MSRQKSYTMSPRIIHHGRTLFHFLNGIVYTYILWQYGLWSKVFKNQSFKRQSSQKKIKLKSWHNFNAIIVFY